MPATANMGGGGRRARGEKYYFRYKSNGEEKGKKIGKKRVAFNKTAV